MLKITKESLASADEKNTQLYINDLEIIFSEQLPFKFELKENYLEQPKVNISIDLSEYINKYIQYIRDTKNISKKNDFVEYRVNLSNHLKDIYSSAYLTRLIQILFNGDRYKVQKVIDTFLFHYLSGFFNEILKNTIDERIQKYFSLKEFLLVENGGEIVASIDFTITYPGEDKISFEFLDKYSRGFPVDFLLKINNSEFREEYLKKYQNNRHYKQQSCLALAALETLDDSEFHLLKHLLPEFVLPNSLKIKDTIKYKDIIFTNEDLQLFLATLNGILETSGIEKLSNIIFNITKNSKVNAVLFGGEGCGIRQIAEVFFNHADIYPSASFSSIGPEFRVRKRSREPKFSDMHISNGIIEGAKISLTTSSESYENTKSNPASEPGSPVVKLSSLSQKFKKNTDGFEKSIVTYADSPKSLTTTTSIESSLAPENTTKNIAFFKQITQEICPGSQEFRELLSEKISKSIFLRKDNCLQPLNQTTDKKTFSNK